MNIFGNTADAGKSHAQRDGVSIRGRNLDYGEMCDVWALADHWPLEDGIRLLRKLPPRRLDPRPGPVRDDWLDVLLELALNCAGESLPVLPAENGTTGPRVRPAELLHWADRKGIPVPDRLREALAAVEAQNEQSLPIPRRKASDLRRERCRALAELYWRHQPEISVQEMAQRPELFEIGCEGRRYNATLLAEWIRDLAPREQGKADD